MKVLHRVQSKAEGPWPSLLFLNQLFSLRKKNKDGDGEDMRRAQTAEIRDGCTTPTASYRDLITK